MKKICLKEHPDKIRETVKLIGATPFFKTVNVETLENVFAKAWLFELAADEYLIRETKESDQMVYILLDGEFEVFASGKFILNIDLPGTTIGEMAVISTNTKRSADVIAVCPARVVAIEFGFLEKDDIQSQKLSNSFLRMFSNILSEKLRVTTERAKLYENAVLEKQEIDKYNKEITDFSKDLEKELQQKLEQIKLYSKVVESNQDPIIISDSQGNLQSGNQAFLTLFGYSNDEIGQLSIENLFKGVVLSEFISKKLADKGWQNQRTAKRKDNSEFPALISTFPIKTDVDGTSEKIVFATEVRDITLQKKYEQNILKANKELKQTYKELENTLQELEKSNRIKDRFLSNISSQLKTPLDSLINYAEIMKKKVGDKLDDFGNDDYFPQIVGEGKKLKKLVGNLLAMAELATEINLSLKIFKFEAFIEELKDQVDEIERLSFRIDEEIQVITADREKLMMALVEIIDYASITRKGDTEIHFNCLRNREKNLLEISIIQGEIPALTSSGNIAGRLADGIELSIQKVELDLPMVKRIIDMHQGEMRIDESEGGQHIQLQLPLDPNAESSIRVKIMIVDEHELDRKLLKGIIEKQIIFYEIYEFDTQMAALNALNAIKPNLVVVDPFFKNQQWSYEQFLRKLIEGNHDKISTLVISDHLTDLDFRNNIISLGITDFLFKPFTIEDALFKITSIIETKQKFCLLSNNIQKARRSAATDGMTGLFNRKYFDNFVKDQLEKAELQNGHCSIIMIDVDNFKHYNDSNGHQLGDTVLKRVAKILQTEIRQSDMAARYGGEEFVIVLPGTAKKMAENIAEKLRSTIEKTEFENEKTQPNGKLTASFGVSSYPENGTTPETVLKGADHCLYVAKERGRNQVVGAEGVVTP